MCRVFCESILKGVPFVCYRLNQNKTKSAYDGLCYITSNTAREITAQPGNRTHGQLRVTAFHPSVQKVSDHPVDEDGGVWMPVHVC